MCTVLCKRSTVVVGRDIYVLGGFTRGGIITNKVICYSGNEWRTVAHLIYNRYCHTALFRDNCIYV